MSSALPSDAPSHPPEAALVERLGAPLVAALEAHLPGTRRHAEATAAYAFASAAELGLGRERAELIREVAKLHDVGMVYVPVAVLRKPSAELDPAERTLLESHLEAGTRLARGAGIPEAQCEWILDTRERWDGGGPKGLAGEAIAVEARLIRVACAADLLLAGPGFEATIDALDAGAGAELDPRIAETAIAVLARTRN
jgi:HD-GYP domain-containing protein (c-di-GMP phosphodiesterase class II)